MSKDVGNESKMATQSLALSGNVIGELKLLSQQAPAMRSMSPAATAGKVEKKAPSLRGPQKVVTVIVGSEKAAFICHKELLCFHSPFFAAAFNSNLSEGTTQTIVLPDVNVGDFGLLVHWLYTQQIDLERNDHDANLVPLAKLWNFAARFSITKLQNKIMDQLRPLVEFAEEQNLKAFLHYTYESKDATPLKRLAADRIAWATTGETLAAWIENEHLPDGMLVDIVMSLMKGHVHGNVTKNIGFGDAREYYVKAKVTLKVDSEEN